jgi:hypothetical protein
LCTDPCTNLITGSLAVPAQMPGSDGGDCGLPRFCRPTDTRREALTSGSI